MTKKILIDLVPTLKLRLNSHEYSSSLRLYNNHQRVCMLTVPIILWIVLLRSHLELRLSSPVGGVLALHQGDTVYLISRLV